MSKKDKYYAVNQDCAGYYNSIEEVKRDLENFIPYGEKSLTYDNKIVVYELNGKDESDLSFDDIVFEFYDNKLHYFHSGRVVNYIVPKPKQLETYKLYADGKFYDVKAYSLVRARKILRDYLKKRRNK